MLHDGSTLTIPECPLVRIAMVLLAKNHAGIRCDEKGPNFEYNLSCVTLLGCICAVVESILPSWIFKGIRLPS